jgi:hypothetical protein
VTVIPPRFFKSFNITCATVSLEKQDDSTHVLNKKPRNPKMFLGWIHATRIDKNS